MDIVKLITFGGLILSDIARISADGEITAEEVAEVVIKAVKVAGLDLKIKL